MFKLGIAFAFLASIGLFFVESFSVLSRNGAVPEGRKEVIKEFQRLSHLGEAGIGDTHTMKQMPKLRCGMTDEVSHSKFANYMARATRKWLKTDLTYRILEYSTKLPPSVIKERVAKAFKMWSDVSQLNFTEVVAGDADLVVRFTFDYSDGKGGVLGRGEYPRGGHISMDDAENWVVESNKGQPLLPPLVHEIGHALGLGHSEHGNSIMLFSFDIDDYKVNWTLGHDDIDGIQFLYGKPKNTKPTTTTTTHKFPCPFNFSAAMTVGNKTYGFVKNQVYEILPNGKSIRPRSITSVFPKGPHLVQAAAHDGTTGRTFLFSGRLAWRFTDHKLDAGFPKKTKYFIRNALMLDGYLTGFSLSHFHSFDEDTMEDDFEGEVPISEEYPRLVPSMIKSIVSYAGDSRYKFYVFYKKRVLKMDIDSPEIYEERC